MIRGATGREESQEPQEPQELRAQQANKRRRRKAKGEERKKGPNLERVEKNFHLLRSFQVGVWSFQFFACRARGRSCCQ